MLEEKKIKTLHQVQDLIIFLILKTQVRCPLLVNMNSPIKRLAFQVQEIIKYPKRNKKEELVLEDKLDLLMFIRTKKTNLDLAVIQSFVVLVVPMYALQRPQECLMSPSILSVVIIFLT